MARTVANLKNNLAVKRSGGSLTKTSHATNAKQRFVLKHKSSSKHRTTSWDNIVKYRNKDGTYSYLDRSTRSVIDPAEILRLSKKTGGSDIRTTRKMRSAGRKRAMLRHQRSLGKVDTVFSATFVENVLKEGVGFSSFRNLPISFTPGAVTAIMTMTQSFIDEVLRRARTLQGILSYVPIQEQVDAARDKLAALSRLRDEGRVSNERVDEAEAELLALGEKREVKTLSSVDLIRHIADEINLREDQIRFSAAHYVKTADVTKPSSHKRTSDVLGGESAVAAE
jgi:hypothetical protein